MTSLALAFYLFVVLPDFHVNESEKQTVIRPLKRIALTTFIIAIITSLIPNERQVYLITAAYVGTTTIQNIQESPEFAKARTILQHKMDEYIKENNLEQESKK